MSMADDVVGFPLSSCKPLDLKRVPRVHRIVLAKLLKHHELPRSDLVVSTYVAGRRRKRHSDITEGTIELAIGQLTDARLVEEHVCVDGCSGAADSWAPGGEIRVNIVRLTVEGWAIAASLDVDKVYR